MFRPARLSMPPHNLHDFVAEIRPPFEALYGPQAGAYYGATALAGIATTILNPAIRAYGSMDGDRAAGLLFVRRDGGRTAIAFFHVLEPFRHGEWCEALLEFALGEHLETEVEVITEFVPFDGTVVDPVFARHGFKKIPRQLMRRRPWADGPSFPAGMDMVYPEALEELAFVLADTYAYDEGRALFPEVQLEAAALEYLRRVQRGDFGIHRLSYTIAARSGGHCAGFVTGSQVLPGLGFVLHMAVRPSFQRMGLGAALLGALSAGFAREGLDYIALGVTCDNPAVKLYEKAGFVSAAQVPVFHRG